MLARLATWLIVLTMLVAPLCGGGRAAATAAPPSAAIVASHCDDMAMAQRSPGAAAPAADHDGPDRAAPFDCRLACMFVLASPLGVVPIASPLPLAATPAAGRVPARLVIAFDPPPPRAA